jgi:hypothetical protein
MNSNRIRIQIFGRYAYDEMIHTNGNGRGTQLFTPRDLFFEDVAE